MLYGYSTAAAKTCCMQPPAAKPYFGHNCGVHAAQQVPAVYF